MLVCDQTRVSRLVYSTQQGTFALWGTRAQTAACVGGGGVWAGVCVGWATSSKLARTDSSGGSEAVASNPMHLQASTYCQNTHDDTSSHQRTNAHTHTRPTPARTQAQAQRGVKQSAITQPEEGDPLGDRYGDPPMVQSTGQTGRKWTRIGELTPALDGQTVRPGAGRDGEWAGQSLGRLG